MTGAARLGSTRCSVGDAVQAQAFGDVAAAVIGGQDDGIIDVETVEQAEEIAEIAVETGELQASLQAARAIGVPDRVGRGGADR